MQAVMYEQEKKKDLAAGQGMNIPIGELSPQEHLFKDFSKIGSLLVSGTTGSGKSSFVLSLIAGLARNNSPDKVRFIIFDSKKADYYSTLQDSPYLLVPIITEKRMLEIIIGILREDGPSAFYGPNDNSSADVFLIIDDYAEVADSKKIEEDLTIILRTGIYRNIHVVIVTSTPSADFLPAGIRALIPHRIAFTTANAQTSRMIIGQSGAESLHYPGELMYTCGSEIIRCYATHYEQPKEVIEAAVAEYMSDPDTLAKIAADIFSDNGDDINKTQNDNSETFNDDLLEDAISFILKSKQASVSMLQRRFRIGYTRAEAIIDEIERRGIIGPWDGGRPRKVLLSEDEYYNGKESEEKSNTDTDSLSQSSGISIDSNSGGITLAFHDERNRRLFQVRFFPDNVISATWKKGGLFSKDGLIIELSRTPEYIFDYSENLEGAHSLAEDMKQAMGANTIVMPIMRSEREHMKKVMFTICKMAGVQLKII